MARPVKNAPNAPINSSEQVEAIFNSSLEGMLIVNEEARYVDANPAACRILGRPRSEVLGKLVGSFSTEPRGTLKYFMELLTTHAPLAEGSIRTPEDKIRHIEYSVRTNYLPGRHLIVTRDVTERRRLEQQLLQSQKMEAVGQLAGGIAHDFNNMLTAIRGYSELLQRSLDPESVERRYADSILSAADKAAMTTQSLLAFSRQQVIQPRELNINEVAQEMAVLLQKLIGEDIRLSMSLSNQIGIVKMDPGQLSQVLLNLAINARDAMPNGGSLTIESANVMLDQSYVRAHLNVRPGPYVMLSVSDSGCGMSQEIISRIFEPFFTTKPAGKGTGLGLSIIYGIVEQAKGAVYVYSELGQGTCFKIYLPRVDIRRSSENRETYSRPLVLLIDDDIEICTVTTEFLRTRGYEVEHATSGGDALEICERLQRKIAVLVSDVNMPGADGLDIQGYFAINHPETRMLYISGYTRKTLRDRGILPPESEFLQKPFRMDELAERIEAILARAESPAQKRS
ncbi:MAG TPA: ATP-binding protein [Terriglobales bacterium]